MRLARVYEIDECTGLPVSGANNGYWFDCAREWTWEPDIEEGDTTTLQNDCKKICWQLTDCDDLIRYTVGFQLLNPDYELESLLTGWPLIVDTGGDTVGINQDQSIDCAPWVGLELFEEVPKDVCEAGFEIRRIVFPKLRFKPPGVEKEEQFRVQPWTATTAPGLVAAYGTGPWDDSGIDFSTADPAQKTHKLEYFDTAIDPDSLAGQCGYVAVP